MSITQELTALTTWQQLCDCFTNDPGLWNEVSLALDAPDDYLRRYPERLRARGVATSEQVSPWLALVEWLDENDRLAELNGDASSEDLADYLASLPLLASGSGTGTGTGTDVNSIAAEKVHFAFAVPRANAILARSFWTLLFLDVDSDTVPLALVSTEAAPRISQLAMALGHSARTVDERDTAARIARGERGYSVAPSYLPAAQAGPAPVNFGKRFLAFAIDTVLLVGVMFGAAALGVEAAKVSYNDIIPTFLLAGFVIYLAALVFFVGRTGQTLGLMTLGLRLVRVDNGASPGYAAAAGRGALTVTLVFGIWAIVVFITTLVDPSGRGLHDKAAGLLMIDKRRRYDGLAGTGAF